jgi:hypothetical protein
MKRRPGRNHGPCVTLIASALLVVPALAAQQRAPWDPAVGVAKIARATMLAQQSPDEANALMLDALREWQQQQATTTATSLPAALAKDVSDIRKLLLEDEGTGGWKKQFSWTDARPRFQVMNPQVMVTVGDAVATRETIYPAFSSGTMLFMTSDQLELLVEALITAVGDGQTGGCVFKTFPAEVLKFVGQYLPAETAFICGGLRSFGSLPKVSSIRFTDAAGTHATAQIDAFLSGGSVDLEKVGATWRITNSHMTYIE